MKYIANFTSAVLFENGPVEMNIAGNSMWPYYTDGQVVKIYPKKQYNLYPGKCYVFLKKDILIIHRLICTFQSIALFAGDASNSIERVELDHIIGIPEKNSPAVSDPMIALINYMFLPFKKFKFIFNFRKYIIQSLIKGFFTYEN
jgi:hypothetical protein